MTSKAALAARVAALIIVTQAIASCGALPSKTTAGQPTATGRDHATALPPQPTLPKMEGSYRVIAGPPGTIPVTWEFTPCGDGCAQVEMGQASGQRATARYINMNWSIDLHSNAALQCGNGTYVPGTAHYSWNPDTLQGRYWSTADSHPCGNDQSLDTYPVPLTLTKAGP